MSSASFKFRPVYALPLILAASMGASATPGEKITLEDGTTCTVIEGNAADASAPDGHSVTSSVTAGSGKVSGSTAMTGGTPSAGSSASSSSAGSSTSSNGAGESFASSSITRPDGTVVTRNSDGTCEIMKPKQ